MTLEKGLEHEGCNCSLGSWDQTGMDSLGTHAQECCSAGGGGGANVQERTVGGGCSFHFELLSPRLVPFSALFLLSRVRTDWFLTSLQLTHCGASLSS